MICDVQKYLPYIENIDLPEEKKKEAIVVLWNFMADQIRYAFNNTEQSCGHEENALSIPTNFKLDSNNFKHLEQFNHLSGD